MISLYSLRYKRQRIYFLTLLTGPLCVDVNRGLWRFYLNIKNIKLHVDDWKIGMRVEWRAILVLSADIYAPFVACQFFSLNVYWVSLFPLPVSTLDSLSKEHIHNEGYTNERYQCITIIISLLWKYFTFLLAGLLKERFR